ncbi:MAG: response regulator [Microcoleus sp. PH2017_17_BER_D_A]|nr:response regulator [Microcoleus sp. PH2017_17_BER_D_A]
MELLSHLPIDTGMAFVMIQHMLPTQESLLTEILARSTLMPVNEVTDGVTVAPNQVYVIPPNASMTIESGLLKLTPRGRGRGAFMSVDTFLIALAAERGNKAIAVVLSGGDGDGARGLEAIKGAGGITFAQSEASAQFTSMPHTAVATGQVDFILRPEQIAQKIAEIGCHPYIADRAAIESAVSQDAIATIYNLLLLATGVDFTHYKQTTLKRRIQRRMLLYKLERIEDYAAYLQNTPTEVTALYGDVLIHVTSFFRDSESFDALNSKVFPEIVKNKSPKSPIRIWIAGCSTGEEAYSIAICLLESLTERDIDLPVQIYATDISDSAIAIARSGFYTSSQVADVSRDRLQRFFVQVEGGYQIAKQVRELCVFARQNLINDPPFSRMDLISCRNVLIYLGSLLQKKLLPMFHYGLSPEGFLLLGTSETIGEFGELFGLCDQKNKIYVKKQLSHWLSIDLTASQNPLTAINPPLLVPPSWNEMEMEKQADLIVLNEYAPVGVVINSASEILQFRGQTSSYLEPAPGKASFNLLKMAKSGLRLELRGAIQQAKNQQLPSQRTGLQIIEVEQIELNPVIENAIEVVRLAAAAKNIQLESRITPLSLKLLGDPSRLQQVLWNLLSNAIKFTPAGGRIDISSDYIDGMAQIQIRDTGKGIDANFLPYVFDRFRQADSSYSRSNSGLGLGLSIVYHLVELHGGSIRAESGGEEQGAMFTLRLPLLADTQKSSALSVLEAVAEVDVASQPVVAIPQIPSSLAGVRVLLVDDEAYLRQLFTTMLDEYGVETSAAASATEAISMLTANPDRYDLLLSDIGMPEQDGYSLMRQIRTLSVEEGGEIPAAAITAYAKDDDRRSAIAAGFQIHVAKPIDSAQLA